MLDFEQGCLLNREAWLRLLAAYAEAEEKLAIERKAAAPVAVKPPENGESPAAAEVAEAEESATGWASRVSLIDGIDPDGMSPLHGRVIALGYLKFQLVDRQIGLRYRLTPEGRRALATADREAQRAA